MTCRRLTDEELRQGFVVCDCERYAHVLRAEVLRRVESGGELCTECAMFLVPVDDLRRAGLLSNPTTTEKPHENPV